MKWEDFCHYQSLNTIDVEYEPTNIECPKCGELLKKYIRVVLASYPPKYRYDCLKCGWSDYK